MVHLITDLYRNWYGPPHHRSLQELVWSTSSPLSTGNGVVHLIKVSTEGGVVHLIKVSTESSVVHLIKESTKSGVVHPIITLYGKWCGPLHHSSLREVVCGQPHHRSLPEVV